MIDIDTHVLQLLSYFKLIQMVKTLRIIVRSIKNMTLHYKKRNISQWTYLQIKTNMGKIITKKICKKHNMAHIYHSRDNKQKIKIAVLFFSE